MGGKKRILWSVAAMLLFAATIPFEALHAQQAGGVVARPTQIDPENPRTRSIFIHTIAPGETAEDRIVMINRSSKDQVVQLTSVDGTITNTGSYACMQNADPVERSGGWITFSREKVNVPAHGEAAVNFSITVPKTAAPGEHNSCITVNDGARTAATNEGVTLRMRQAIRVAVAVPGDIQRELSIEEFTPVDQSPDQYIMRVRNKGNVSADVDMQARVINIFHRHVASFGGEYVIVPEAELSQQFAVDFRPLFGGWYRIEPAIRYDARLGIFGTNSESAAYEQETGDSMPVFFWPTAAGWLILIGGIAAIVTGGAWLNRYRLRRRSVIYTVRNKDTIKSLAERSGYRWRTIAKINQLKPPYELARGQHLKLPIRQSRSLSKGDK